MLQDRSWSASRPRTEPHIYYPDADPYEDADSDSHSGPRANRQPPSPLGLGLGEVEYVYGTLFAVARGSISGSGVGW